jgi:hypothetical protein
MKAVVPARLVALTVAVALALVTFPSRSARAQSWVYGGTAGLATGIEGNGQANGGPRAARTRLRLDVDLHVDEFPQERFGFGILADVIPRAAFGVDAHYIQRISPRFEVAAGGIVYLAPSTLFGPSVDLWYRIPLSKGAAFVVGPEANVFIGGSDLPEGTIIWQGLIQVGIHADL